MAYRIIQEAEACIGCGSCAAVCPDNWAMRGNKALPKSTKIRKPGCNQDAADACPVQCIRIEELSE